MSSVSVAGSVAYISQQNLQSMLVKQQNRNFIQVVEHNQGKVRGGCQPPHVCCSVGIWPNLMIPVRRGMAAYFKSPIGGGGGGLLSIARFVGKISSPPFSSVKIQSMEGARKWEIDGSCTPSLTCKLCVEGKMQGMTHQKYFPNFFQNHGMILNFYT